MQINGELLSTVSVATDPGSTIGLNPKRGYTLKHTGLDANEAEDVNDIMIALGDATLVAGEGLNKGLMQVGDTLTLQNVSMIRVMARGGAPCLLIRAGLVESETK